MTTKVTKSAKPKAKKASKKIVVSYILDQSGSMISVKPLTINTFNEYVQNLKKENKDFKFGLTLFNSAGVFVKYDGVDLNKVEELNDRNYIPDQLTPLYDAIGKTIVALEKSHDKDNILCVIQTDGLENASSDYTREKIFKMIEDKRKKGWEFVFLGANQDAWQIGLTLGITHGNTFTYDPAVGTKHQLFTATASYSDATARGSSTSNLLNQEKKQ